jgi:hypothetical protein
MPVWTDTENVAGACSEWTYRLCYPVLVFLVHVSRIE